MERREASSELNSSKHQNEVLKISKPQNGVLETPTLTDPKQLEGLGTKLTIKEMAVIKLSAENNHISLKELAGNPGISKGTIDRIIKSLKEKGILQRLGAKNNSTWKINIKSKQ